jgi:hypothetical protein
VKLLEMVEAIHARTCGPEPDQEVEALKEATRPERVIEHIEHYVEEAPSAAGIERVREDRASR